MTSKLMRRQPSPPHWLTIMRVKRLAVEVPRMPSDRLAPPDLVAQLLALRLIATLGTSNADGSPHLTPIWFLYEDGLLYLPTGSGSRKVRNVRSRPVVSVLIDQRQPACHRWASTTGTAEIVDGQEAATINARVRERYVSAAGELTYGKLIEAYDDVTLVITPGRWRSWTPTALNRLADQHGLADSALADWFTPWDI